jgi:hypothetical protein
MINRRGPQGTRDALRATGGPMPVGAGALIGPDGGSPLGLVDDGIRPAGSPGAALDQALADLDARVTHLEQGEAGEAS